MTVQQLKERFPHASESFLRANADRAPRVSPPEPKSTQGKSLVGAGAGEETGAGSPAEVDLPHCRVRIVFRIFAVRPSDWDNYHIKEIQDGLVHAGLLSGDAWHQLEGRIISEKVHSREDERTEIVIEEAQD